MRFKMVKIKALGRTEVQEAHKIKGRFLFYQRELPVPDSQGWIYSFNQPHYCTKPSTDGLMAHPQGIYNLKTPVYNHKFVSSSITERIHPLTFTDIDLTHSDAHLLLCCVP